MRTGIIEASARYQVAAQLLRNIDLDHSYIREPQSWKGCERCRPSRSIQDGDCVMAVVVTLS